MGSPFTRRLDSAVPDLTINAKPLGGHASCPLCSETLAHGGPARECPGCAVSYHVACLDELGGCGTLGCPRAKGGHARRVSPTRQRPTRAQPSRGGTQPSPFWAPVIVALVVGLVVVLAKSKDSPPAEPPQVREGRDFTPPEPVSTTSLDQINQALRQYKSRETESAHFVLEVLALAEKRELTRDPERLRQDPDLADWKDWRQRGARLRYENLLETADKSPREVREDLRRRVLEELPKANHWRAEETLAEVFAMRPLKAAPQAPDSSDATTEQERELRQAAVLLAAGKDRDDPRVQQHVNAAAAYGQAARSDISPDQRSELRQVAALIAAGKDRNDPEVQRHLNAAEAYQASARSDLSPEQRRELRQAAALLAAGWDRNDPGVLKHVEAAAAYGRAAEQAAKSE